MAILKTKNHFESKARAINIFPSNLYQINPTKKVTILIINTINKVKKTKIKFNTLIK